MIYIFSIIVIALLALIIFLCYHLYVKSSNYKYRVNQVEDLKQTYGEKIQELKGEIDGLNETAYTHTVTKIGNIDFFIDRCSSLFDKYPHSSFTMVGFSISNMSKINQFYGPGEGDKVMIYTADVLKNTITGSGTYAHVNSNLFGILLRDPRENAIHKLVQTISDRLEKYSDTFAVEAIFGIYVIDRDKTDDSLMDIMNCTLLAQKAIKDQIGRAHV